MNPEPADDVVLDVKDLCTEFVIGRTPRLILDHVSFSLRRGRTTAVVGESGSGKTVTALSILQLIEAPGRITGGQILFNGVDLTKLDEAAMQSVRGARIGMVFQDPLTSLNPSLSIGSQIAETLLAHQSISRAEAARQAIELLTHVGVPDAARRADDYPHHFSGGMRQRVLIAIAVSCQPEIIIADEPTTALDVTVQAKILRLLHTLQSEMQAALLLITHDLGVVANLADEVVVMYAGHVVERADVDTLFHAPRHPYTRALLDCAISLDDDRRKPLEPITGVPPDLRHRPPGCQFAPRCPQVMPRCRMVDPALVSVAPGHEVACLLVAAETADV
ncbi:MAG TPA: ABC transporter ATP-binding protein [Acidisoma sp.]|uniref:ABC transporter ATP-binding protein n=1 Tax=Acidisoma sp. TaxID=1872115 RepID=UPI002C83F114|nr:ABC transporter ATP-binding protein [Acidisoma sp.]HTI03288.1 ABC transporter ATP-binding protein [Acidisoma sp.]